ncbi:MAG: bifunctional precorrin-2 dehydrogenase/sirohydrochlorin ferrochelatase, partial [Acidobacteriota bacterium]|nr:bifunctional precorrin-2 dehydrogenase/sirohydrochlorin ferrochelatase [Acidobacteriota bacterium]
KKIASLLRAGAEIRVVAPKATRRVRAWARARKIRWDARPFRASDLAGTFLVVAATPSPGLHAEIHAQARRRGVLCNAVDDPEHCDFYYGAVVRRGALQIAVSTEGHSPALAQRLKRKIAAEFGPDYKSWLAKIGKTRKRLFAERNLPPARRAAILRRLASEKSFQTFQHRSKGGRMQPRKSRK